MRVAIVNDLGIATEALRRLLASEPGCTVAWTAADGEAAVALCARDLPDLVLMDLVMPVLDGVEATRRIMRSTPCPILVVTATVDGNLERVYNALGAGALDAVALPALGTDGGLEGVEGILRKIRLLRRMSEIAAPGTPFGRAATSCDGGAGERPPLVRSPGGVPCVLVGASTGGPEAVRVLLRGFATAFEPPIVVVQHLDPVFVPGFVQWLARATGRRVRSVVAGDRPEEGTVLVASTVDHLAFVGDGSLRYPVDPVDDPYRPSIDVFFSSAAIPALPPGVAVVLTGMGRDGARGVRTLRHARWRTFAQDAATSVVYGMPRAATEGGGVENVVPLPQMGASIQSAYRALARACARARA